mmetsp:Transcript_18793/g.33754  ORF Transcript_18793/g.33754 Transcript_18793/m.33754 type:complete len:460 (-) Transcript_18793:13-1392(-)
MAFSSVLFLSAALPWEAVLGVRFAVSNQQTLEQPPSVEGLELEETPIAQLRTGVLYRARGVDGGPYDGREVVVKFAKDPTFHTDDILTWGNSTSSKQGNAPLLHLKQECEYAIKLSGIASPNRLFYRSHINGCLENHAQDGSASYIVLEAGGDSLADYNTCIKGHVNQVPKASKPAAKPGPKESAVNYIAIRMIIIQCLRVLEHLQTFTPRLTHTRLHPGALLVSWLPKFLTLTTKHDKAPDDVETVKFQMPHVRVVDFANVEEAGEENALGVSSVGIMYLQMVCPQLPPYLQWSKREDMQNVLGEVYSVNKTIATKVQAILGMLNSYGCQDQRVRRGLRDNVEASYQEFITQGDSKPAAHWKGEQENYNSRMPLEEVVLITMMLAYEANNPSKPGFLASALEQNLGAVYLDVLKNPEAYSAPPREGTGYGFQRHAAGKHKLTRSGAVVAPAKEALCTR